MYTITIPSMNRVIHTESLRKGLMNAIIHLNHKNGKVNMITSMSDRDLMGQMMEGNKVVAYTQFGDMIAIEREVVR